MSINARFIIDIVDCHIKWAYYHDDYKCILRMPGGDIQIASSQELCSLPGCSEYQEEAADFRLSAKALKLKVINDISFS